MESDQLRAAPPNPGLHLNETESKHNSVDTLLTNTQEEKQVQSGFIIYTEMET